MMACLNRCSRALVLGLAAGALLCTGANNARAEAQLLIEASTGKVLHGGLLECAVVGVADQHSGEVAKLFAVKKDPNLTAADLRTFLASRLASYKMPRQIEFRDELPKTNVGKILRRALRDESTGQAAS